MVVGLTGSIGMGKSTVTNWMREMGVPVIDSDALVHQIYQPGGAAVGQVKELFGVGVLAADGSVDRPSLTNHVVGPDNKDNLKKLEAVIFPHLDAARHLFIMDAQDRGEALVVFDMPLLFERKMEANCDRVVVVSAPQASQRERVMARPGMTPEKFASILSKQVPDWEKRERADTVIDTGTEPAATQHEVAVFVARCRAGLGDERRRRKAATVTMLAGLALGAFAVVRWHRRRSS